MGLKKDCFAYWELGDRPRCKALIDTPWPECKYDECPFYKARERFERDRDKWKRSDDDEQT